jgi:hypothetical protein
VLCLGCHCASQCSKILCTFLLAHLATMGCEANFSKSCQMLKNCESLYGDLSNFRSLKVLSVVWQLNNPFMVGRRPPDMRPNPTLHDKPCMTSASANPRDVGPRNPQAPNLSPEAEHGAPQVLVLSILSGSDAKSQIVGQVQTP